MKAEQKATLKAYLYMIKLIRKDIDEMKWNNGQEKLDANDAAVSLIDVEHTLKSMVK